jgi:hypothetical protein
MTRNEKIFERLSESFKTKDFLKWGPADGFHCECEAEGECNVNKGEQPILSPFFGDGECNVMVVAEKPSGAGGVGPRIGGRFADIPKGRGGLSRKDPLFDFRHFATTYCYGVTPYMTDLAKCGYRGTEPPGDELRTRFKNCFKQFLVEEIRVVEPEKILCVGRVAYDYLVDRQKQGEISAGIELIWLTHYSRQAQLHLSPQEKVELWRWQASRGKEKKLEEMRLADLECIMEMKKRWQES